jgi:hypothetical protein
MSSVDRTLDLANMMYPDAGILFKGHVASSSYAIGANSVEPGDLFIERASYETPFTEMRLQRSYAVYANAAVRVPAPSVSQGR